MWLGRLRPRQCTTAGRPRQAAVGGGGGRSRSIATASLREDFCAQPARTIRNPSHVSGTADSELTSPRPISTYVRITVDHRSPRYERQSIIDMNDVARQAGARLSFAVANGTVQRESPSPRRYSPKEALERSGP